MVHDPVNRLEYAAKFFILEDAFERERELYHGKNPLGKFLPQVTSLLTTSMQEASHSQHLATIYLITGSMLFCNSFLLLSPPAMQAKALR
jgi:hypothetical protein